MTLRAEGIDAALVDGGRGAGAVAVFHVLVIRGIGMLPERLAGGFVEAQDALYFGIEDVIVDEHAAAGHDGAGIAISDFGAPAEIEPGGGNFFENAGLAPDAVAVRAAPLRPVT